MIMGLTTRSCRLGGTISGRMKQWQLSGSTVGCATGLPASGDGPALCRKRSRWSTPPSHCLPPTMSIEQRQNSPCHCILNTLANNVASGGVVQERVCGVLSSYRRITAVIARAADYDRRDYRYDRGWMRSEE